MAINEETDRFQFSSDKNQRIKIKEALYEIVGALAFIDDKRDYIKDVLDTLKESYGLPKKYSSKLAKGLHKNKIKEIVSEVKDLEAIYDTLFVTAALQQQDTSTEDEEVS
jgi:uncharacterized protein Yka (UPF0111/DUF47 family)